MTKKTINFGKKKNYFEKFLTYLFISIPVFGPWFAIEYLEEDAGWFWYEDIQEVDIK